MGKAELQSLCLWARKADDTHPSSPCRYFSPALSSPLLSSPIPHPLARRCRERERSRGHELSCREDVDRCRFPLLVLGRRDREAPRGAGGCRGTEGGRRAGQEACRTRQHFQRRRGGGKCHRQGRSRPRQATRYV
jgi:hypothetical protein